MNMVKKVLFYVMVCCISASPTNAWIIVLNGTSSAGKTTMARNLQASMKEPSEILQYDIEADLLLKEQVESMGYRHDAKLSIRNWFNSLPADVKKTIDDIDDDVAWTSVQTRIVEKAQKLNEGGANVIIDTGLKTEDDYNLFVNGLHTDHTYFVLVYASINQLLKNLIARNNSGNSEEERNPLGPIYQYFWFLAKKCDATASDALDVITKKDFDAVFEQLEVLIASKDTFDDFWVSTKDFKKIKSIIEHMFFHSCWGYTPQMFEGWAPWLWFKSLLPCYCDGLDAVGITPKLAFHDFVINTGSASPIECATMLNAWLVSKV